METVKTKRYQSQIEGEKRYKSKNIESLRAAARAYAARNREARRQYARKYREQNKERLAAERAKNIQSVREKQNHYQRVYRSGLSIEKKNAHKERAKKYISSPAIKAKIRMRNNEWVKKYRKTNPQFAIATSLRRSQHKHLKGVKCAKSEKLTGCTWLQLRSHLESQFKCGMSWDNYGTEWHVDHILPYTAFDLTKPENQLIVCNWQNLRPMWAADNLSKSDKITEPQLHLPLCIATLN